ncbi:MAG: hypothetical protein HZA00_13730, partial [Nitrospinae bacterium]|nr:hypothetical protein [Nitrospinota bacterium]
GEIIPITSEGHGNLVEGLTEDPETLESTPLFTPEDMDNMRHLSQWEFQEIERKKLIQYVLNHPADILKLMVKKIILFWSVTPEVERSELKTDFFIKIFMVLWSSYSIIVYVLAIAGIFSFKDKTILLLIILIMASFTIMHMFFLVVPEKRFRLPLEPYLVILASAGLSSLISRIQSLKKWRLC